MASLHRNDDQEKWSRKIDFTNSIIDFQQQTILTSYAKHCAFASDAVNIQQQLGVRSTFIYIYIYIYFGVNA